MKYSVYDQASGEISRHVICPEKDCHLQLRGGEALIEGHHDRRDFLVRAGQAVRRAEPLRDPEPTYAERRAVQYPPVAEQLDALWKGGEAEAAMRARVMDVKTKFPKPATDTKDPA